MRAAFLPISRSPHVLLFGFLETIFFLSTGFVWFFLVVAVMGLHLQANASLVEDEAERDAGRAGGDAGMAAKPVRPQVSPAARSG